MNQKIISILIFNVLLYYPILSQIYGVRWFLGPKFGFEVSPQKQKLVDTYYILAFNSQTQIHAPITLRISNSEFTCSSKHIILDPKKHHFQIQGLNTTQTASQQQFETYIYMCNINKKLAGILSYQIVTTISTYTNDINNKTILDNKKEKIFFNGTFRTLKDQGHYQLLVIGDWGEIPENVQSKKGYVPIDKCVLQKINDSKDIRGILFNGDIAYDLQGDVYISMLKYIQPITSQMIWLTVPGNHDTIYHDDSFVLFVQSFLTPQWKDYHNYFFTVQLGSDLVIIGYNPQTETQNYTRMSKILNMKTIFSQFFIEQRIAYLRQNKTVIVFSHYPMYCSDSNDDLDSCNNYKILTNYSNYFQKIGMDLYISGHLHTYQRMSAICPNKNSTLIFGKQFQGVCPIYIIEGAGGNAYYVQMKDEYQKAPHSEKLVYNTGFGILSINQKDSPRTESYQYAHILAKTCQVSDYVKISIPYQSPSHFNHIFAEIFIIAIGLLFIIGICYFYFRQNKKRGKKQQIEMVEEVDSNKDPQ